ncbi:modulator of macroautophagy TMEM150B-B-like [Saccoglossus kowalevskii]
MVQPKWNIGWGILPVLFATTAIATFVVCYIIAVSLDHIIAFVPYVSDTGAYPPESCIFSQFLNLAAAIAIVAVFIRYKGLRNININVIFSRMNLISFVLGVLTAVGVSMVGNFQSTNMPLFHYIGATLAFGIGTIYCWMQSIMTYMLYPKYNGLWIVILRFVLTVIITIALITFFLGLIMQNISEDTTTAPTASSERTEEPTEELTAAYLTTAISEWVLAIFLLCWCATLAVDLRRYWVKTDVGLLSNEQTVTPKRVSSPIIIMPRKKNKVGIALPNGVV